MGVVDQLRVRRLVTEEDVHEAMDVLRRTVRPIGAARGRMIAAEHRLKHIKALEMKFAKETSVNAQEREAYASDRYAEAIEELQQATVAYEVMRAERETAEITLDVYRTQEATLRGSAKL